MSDAYGALGMVHLETGNHGEAINAYGRALAIEPKRAEFIAGRAAALSLRGSHTAALAKFEEALRLESDVFLWEPALKRYYDKSVSAINRLSDPNDKGT